MHVGSQERFKRIWPIRWNCVSISTECVCQRSSSLYIRISVCRDDGCLVWKPCERITSKWKWKVVVMFSWKVLKPPISTSEVHRVDSYNAEVSSVPLVTYISFDLNLIFLHAILWRRSFNLVSWGIRKQRVCVGCQREFEEKFVPVGFCTTLRQGTSTYPSSTRHSTLCDILYIPNETLLFIYCSQANQFGSMARNCLSIEIGVERSSQGDWQIENGTVWWSR